MTSTPEFRRSIKSVPSSPFGIEIKHRGANSSKIRLIYPENVIKPFLLVPGDFIRVEEVEDKPRISEGVYNERYGSIVTVPEDKIVEKVEEVTDLAVNDDLFTEPNQRQTRWGKRKNEGNIQSGDRIPIPRNVVSVPKRIS